MPSFFAARAAAVVAFAVCCAPAHAGAAVAPTAGAAGAEVPAVDVVPVGTHPTDPNGGLWFVHRIARGDEGHGAAMLINPARVPQVVHLYARAVDFSSTGAPSVSDDASAGVASWLRFSPPVLTVPPLSRVTVGYDVTVPGDADPGDHTGAIVAESGATTSSGVTIVKRIATRFYVTVPGHVVVAFRLDELRHSLHSPLWPSVVDARVLLVNTGSIRVAPSVAIDGRAAGGSTLVLAHSVEPFGARVHVPWYGGRVRLRAVATVDGGAPQVITKSFWVIPWLLVALALVALGALVHATSFVLRRRRRRRAEERALRERLAHLEAAVPEQWRADDIGAVSR